MKIRIVLVAAALGLSLPVGAAAQAAGGNDPAAVVNAAVERALESRAKGSDSAAVVVFEIADFQCPYCATFVEDVAPAVHERYVDTGLVRWVFVNMPLHSHALAWHAAEAALCAGAAGDAFWPMHDLLFERQSEWGDAEEPGARFAAYAAELDVPAAAFAACTAEDRIAPLILQDVGSVASAGITGTPTFLIMKDQQVIQRLVGVRPVEEWAEALDGALGR